MFGGKREIVKTSLKTAPFEDQICPDDLLMLQYIRAWDGSEVSETVKLSALRYFGCIEVQNQPE